MKIRSADFSTHTRSETATLATTDLTTLTAVAQRLARSAVPEGGVRLIGVSLAGLGDEPPPGLFGDPEPADDATDAARVDRRNGAAPDRGTDAAVLVDGAGAAPVEAVGSAPANGRTGAVSANGAGQEIDEARQAAKTLPAARAASPRDGHSPGDTGPHIGSRPRGRRRRRHPCRRVRLGAGRRARRTVHEARSAGTHLVGPAHGS